MPRPTIRPLAALFMASLLLPSSSSAFDSPLSDTAVREAYFLGQRHDGSLPRFLEKYIKHLPPPKLGPHISSISFFTPFVQLALFSDHYIGNYSAQQAQLDHRAQKEIVRIVIEIHLTGRYGSYISFPAANSRSASSTSLILRPSDFWKDFQVQVSVSDQVLSPATFQGKPNYFCSHNGGGCVLTGATLELVFPPESFTSDSATLLITPPEGGQVSVEFDLSRLR